jgi:hypothetical protein
MAPESRPTQTLPALVREFIAYWTTDRAYGGDVGCGMCGGIPHSTTCYVGRMDALLKSGAVQVGAIVTLGDRTVRVMGMPDDVTVCRDHRKRIAVRNVATDRLSYVPERRLLALIAKAEGR